MNMTKFFRAAIAMSALLVGFAQTAQADIVTWTGDTTGGATFNRPLADLSDYSIVGTDVTYRSIQFTVDDDGEYAFTMHGAGFDTFLILYETAFNPGSGLDNAVVASDDLVNLRTSGFATDLMAGTQYFVVLTSFDNGESGAYSLTVSGDGMITAVPEPSTWLMLAFGLVAVGYTQRHKLQR